MTDARDHMCSVLCAKLQGQAVADSGWHAWWRHVHAHALDQALACLLPDVHVDDDAAGHRHHSVAVALWPAYVWRALCAAQSQASRLAPASAPPEQLQTALPLAAVRWHWADLRQEVWT